MDAGTLLGSDLFRAWAEGDIGARDRLIEIHYDELRAVAETLLGRAASSASIVATELVHESVLQLLRIDRIAIADRRHFIALVARIMRLAIVDRARQAMADKRRHQRVTLVTHIAEEEPPLDALALDAALTRLADVDEERARLVEMRYFVGLSIPEIAELDGSSESTVKRRWRSTRAWLYKSLSQDPAFA